MSTAVTFGLEHARNPVDRAELHRILDELIDARERSDQALAAAPETITFREAKGKDAVARAVAATASHLMLQAAGWATNHNIGRALAEKSGNEIDVNSRDLEIEGQDYARLCYGPHDNGKAELGRAALRAALDPTFYPVPAGLVWEMRDALWALDVGETRALLAPRKSRLHGAPFSLAHLRLNALEHVYFLIGRDRKKGEAWERVAEAVHYSVSTMKDWEERAIALVLSKEEIERRTDCARRAGELVRLLQDDPDYADQTKGRPESIDGGVWIAYQMLKNTSACLASLAKQLAAAKVGSPDY
jgi:hypothetical protein